MLSIATERRRKPPLGNSESPRSLLRQVQLQREAPVLLVDDDPAIVPLVETALRPFQIRFDAIASGAAAMDRLRKRKYGLLILDLGLEDIDGFDVLRQLRGHPQGNHTKVLVLTANTTLEALARSFGHGADDFVSKPFDVHELGMRAFRLLYPQTLY